MAVAILCDAAADDDCRTDYPIDFCHRSFVSSIFSKMTSVWLNQLTATKPAMRLPLQIKTKGAGPLTRSRRPGMAKILTICSWSLVLIGVAMSIAVWAFRRCRKWGYLVVASYFALVVFSLVVWPPIDRGIRAHHPPDFSAQTQQRIDAAVQESIHKVLVEEGHPEGIPGRRNIRFPFGPILLVVGLWLVARQESNRSNHRTATNPAMTTLFQYKIETAGSLTRGLSALRL